ncbi:kinase-like protein [Rhypophila decipiens]|uniref:Kinase-like protein n=1 Tax=Rhypophila decipiens TaxID=261697 RepID=A0AAN6YGZ5_9PEZI|nr:kinase-like protein [Rhypophila decipiens]
MHSTSKDRQLGLYDKSVTICLDRGESQYPRVYQRASSKPPPEISDHSSCREHKDDTVISDIKCELEKIWEHYPTGGYNFFLPRDKLGGIVTPNRVLQVVQLLTCCKALSAAEKEKLRDSICFPDNPEQQRWKLLVILLRNGMQEQLLILCGEGVSDQCLPIRVCEKNKNPPPCRMQGHRHPTIDAWGDKKRRKISQWSYAVKSPYFTRLTGHHSHYILEDNDVLPIKKTRERLSSPDAPTAHQKPETENEQGAIVSGFSEVRIVELDEGHYDFPESDLGSWNRKRGPRQFALKELHSKDSETFSAELASLMRVQDQGSKHLIKVVVTFEIRQAQGTKYYFMFPCAQGDLWLFWKEHQQRSQRIPRALWMSQQVSCLAKGLMLFHNERDHHLKLMGKSHNTGHGKDQQAELYGRHGDMKAENILWFEEEDCNDPNERDWLVITDFGLGRLNSKYSRSGVDPTLVPRTATYKAPEFDLTGGRISRVSDVFSFGCVCLEFLTWYLEGWEAVNDKFIEFRMELDINGFEVDTFFTIENYKKDKDGNVIDKEKQKAIIKPRVKEWINKLKRNKDRSAYTLQFLELIEERMLEPEPKKRITTSELVHELDLLADTCKRSSSFYKDFCESLPPRSG